MTVGGSAADDERTKRSRGAHVAVVPAPRRGWPDAWSAPPCTRWAEVAQPAEEAAAGRSPACRRRCRRRARLASSAATSPWMWNSGITFRQRSPGVSASVRAMLRRRVAEVGVRERDLLRARRGARRVQHEGDVGRRRRCGVAGLERVEVDHGHAPAGGLVQRGRRAAVGDERAGVEVVEVERQLARRVRRVQGRARSGGGDPEEGQRGLGSVRQHDRDRLVAGDRGGDGRGPRPQVLVRPGLPVDGDDGRVRAAT